MCLIASQARNIEISLAAPRVGGYDARPSFGLRNFKKRLEGTRLVHQKPLTPQRRKDEAAPRKLRPDRGAKVQRDGVGSEIQGDKNVGLTMNK